MVTSFKRSHACTCHHQRLLYTHRQDWVSLLWGHCSFLLGPGAHKILFVPSRVCFPVLCKSWCLYFGIKHNFFQEDLCHTQVYCTQSPWLAAGHCWPKPSQETLKHGSSSVSVGSPGPGAHKICALWASLAGILFDSKHDFTPPTILPCFSFILGCQVSFFGGIQRSPVDGCLAASCNFGVLVENESTSFYSASYI